MNRTLSKIKHRVLSTSAGKKLRKIKYQKGFTRENALKTLTEFGIESSEELVSDMMHEAFKHDVTFPEYLMYHFYELDEKARRQIVPIWETGYIDVFNDNRLSDLFYDKEKTYKKFRQFYGRKQIALHKFNKRERDEFLEFFRSAGRIIVKPYDGDEGRGVQLFNNSEGAEDIFEQLRHDYRHGAVVEEVIEQDERMASLHPASLNTLRITTFRFDDEIFVFPLCMRIGTNGAVVDNGGSGGIACQLDENGVIISTCDEKGRSYEYHPTTNKRMIGFQVPDILNAIDLVKRLSATCVEVRYIGWDIALSKDGYIMVEGNSDAGFAGFQVFGKGCRPLMDSIMARFLEEKNK